MAYNLFSEMFHTENAIGDALAMASVFHGDGVEMNTGFKVSDRDSEAFHCAVLID